MADILDRTVWFQTDASNASGGQPSFPENMPAKNLNNAARAMMGALARWADQICAKITTGSGAAYTVNYTIAPQALFDGQRFLLLAHAANSAAPTLNVNALGAKTIRKVVSGVLTDLGASEIGINFLMDLVYNTANNCFILANPPYATTLPVASATVQGIVELATRAESQAGTDTVRAVTPDDVGSLLFKGADVAGGGTISLGDGGYFNITGSGWTATGISYATASALGRKATLRFAGTGTLTNGANLVLPTASNISVQAGDTCDIVLFSGSIYHVINYARASGAALASTVGWVDIFKAADENVNNSSALQNDDHLTFTMNANKTYDIEIYLELNEAHATAGFKMDLNASVAVSRVYMTMSSGTLSDVTITAMNQIINSAGTGAFDLFIKGTVVNGGSNSVFTVRWAQNTAQAANLTMYKESWLSYRER